MNTNKKMSILDEDYMGTLISPYSRAIVTFSEGDIIQGKVKDIKGNCVYVDIGINCEAIIPKEELTDEEFLPPQEVVTIDDKIDVYILKIDEEEGKLILSKKKADYELSWQKIQEVYQNKEQIKVKVKKVTKGGLIVDAFSQDAFLPTSQIDLQKVEDLNLYTNKELEVKITEIDKSQNSIIVSRKIILEEEKESKQAQLLASIKEGDIVKGKVKNIVSYGAFVDLGDNVVGLIHISELAWRRLTHPKEVLQEGQEVNAKVLSIDYQNKKIALGLKQLQPDPWLNIEGKYKVGDLLEGNVSGIAQFGVFVKLDENIEGLVHLNELREGEAGKIDRVYKIGDKVSVKILNIKKGERKIYLSIRQADEEKEKLEYRKYMEAQKSKEVTIGDMFKDLFEKKD